MDVSRPYAAVVPSIDGDVLIALAATTQPMTGRQVAKLVSRGSRRGVSNALERLVEHGIVTRQEAGGSYLHILNREHLAAPAVDVLAGLRTELIRRLRELFSSWQVAPIHASMFGSAARGDGDTSSDIDLLVVRPDDVDTEAAAWRSQIDHLTEMVRTWTGNHAGIVELGQTEFQDLPTQRPPIVEDLIADGIDLGGQSLRPALRTRRR